MGISRAGRKTKITFRNLGGMVRLSAMRKVPKKGRPPPGGEEAEVVVYQPRGVGLMHPRHKPGNAHYTHASAGPRKCCLPMKVLCLQEKCSHRQVS